MIRRIAQVCLAMAVAVTGAVYAQGVQTATLIGTVTDPDGAPLPGVLVTAASPAQLGERTAITETNGDYVIRGLTPGDYTVRFTLEGMTTVEAKASLGLGVSTRVDAQMELLAQSETIVVTAEAPAPLETTTVGANFNTKTIQQLPVVNRTPVGIGSLSGAVTDRTPVAGQLSINGGMAYDNSFLINGVNVQDPIFGQTNNLFIEDAILETQVLTSGISAEYGAFTGGVLNVITKSGGNEFTGSLRADLTRPEWRDETPFEDERGLEREGDLGKVYSATLGGFIVRDRLWFFAAGRDQEQTVTRSVLTANVPDLEENRRWELKLTGNLTPSHSLQASYIDNPVKSTHEVQVTPLEEAAMARNSERENDGFVINYSGVLSNNMFAEARYSEKVFTFVNIGGTSTAIVDSPMRSSSARFPGNVAGTFNAPYFDATDPEDRNNDQLSGSLSYFLTSDRLGSHDIKVGAERFTVTRTGGNGQSATDYVFYTGYAVNGSTPVLDANGRLIPVFRQVATRLGWWVPTRGAQLDITTDSFFINDRWDVNDRLTLNLGIRHEIVESEATGGIVGVDTDTTVPRLGLSYDPLGNGKYKIDVTYAEYAGRYNPAIIGGNSPVGSPALLYGYYVGPEGQGRDFAPGFDPNNYVFFYASVPTQNTFFDDGLSSPVNEELTVSAGMALPRGGHLKATFIDRELTNFIDDFITLDNGCTNVVFEGEEYDCFDNVVYRNTDGPERTYQAIQLQGRYNILDNWTIEGNYTHQLENDGNYEGEGGQSIGATQFGNYPEVYYPSRNNPTGRLSQYQEHKVRLWTTYAMDLGRAGTLAAGLIYRYDSPLTFSYTASVPWTAAQIAAGAPYASPPTFGSQTIFFGERGAGEFNSTSIFDVSLSYSLPVWRSVEPWIKLDVTNVFNDDTLVTYNTGIVANRGAGDPVDQFGLPTTFTPGPSFGQATSATSHVTPREFFISAGIRF